MSEHEFLTSKKTLRSPVGTEPLKTSSNSRKPVSSCQICQKPDNNLMVQCDDCDYWFHYECVGVTDNVKNHDWSCDLCVNTKSDQQVSLPCEKHSIGPTLMSTKKSSSKRSDSSGRKRMQLELQKIEEERALQEKLNKEFLDKKYELLEKLTEISEDQNSESDVLQAKSRSEDIRIQSWLKEQSTVSQPINTYSSHGNWSPNSQADVLTKNQVIGSTNQTTELPSQPIDHAESFVSATLDSIPNSSVQHLLPIVNSSRNYNVVSSWNHNLPQPTYMNQKQVVHADSFVSATLDSIPNSSVQHLLPIVNSSRNYNVVSSWNHNLPQPTYMNQKPIMNSCVRDQAPAQPAVVYSAANLGNAGYVDLSRNLPSTNYASVVTSANSGYVNLSTTTFPTNLASSYSLLPPRSSINMSEINPSNSGNHIPNNHIFWPLSLRAQQNPVYQQGSCHAAPYSYDNQNSSSFVGNGIAEVPVLNQQTIAARHVMPKELPVFNGNPEEWPLFISNFEETTRTCGFTNNENLIRLQRSLKGRALEAVRFRLLLPSNVPEIIATLRTLFGRPELIINTLLQRIRAEPAPKADKLETIMLFALSVQNLCATMEAAGLMAHLCNPTLLQEFTEKLPPNIRLHWAMYKQTMPVITLTTFGSWLYQIGTAVNDVCWSKEISDDRHVKGKGFLNTHASDNGNKTSYADQESTPKTLRECCICNGNCTSVVNCKKFSDLNQSDRWKIVREQQLCRRCLIRHKNLRCNSSKICGQNGCSHGHHHLLHNNSKKDATETTPAVPTSSSVNTHQRPDQDILFRIVPVTLHGKNSSVSTFAFLDDGSSLTLIEDEITRKLNLEGTLDPLCLTWTANTHRLEKSSCRVSVEISSANGRDRKHWICNAHTVKTLNLPIQSMPMNILADKYPHLRNIPVDSYQQAIPRILIGLDNWKLGVPLKVKEGAENQPIATKSRLGWTVYGPCQINEADPRHQFTLSHSFHKCQCLTSQDEIMQNLVKDFFQLESLGVLSKKKLESVEDQRALEILETSTVRLHEHFETGLLWKFKTVNFPNSLPLAKRRLINLEQRMQRDNNLAENLVQQIKNYVRKGYARKLSMSELNENFPRCWYLPIFPVITPSKPGKVRIVWDAAAKVGGVSLNSVLLKGPDLLTSLLAILFRFRERKVAICGDIKEMFHQIHIKSDDQHSQRFLWRDGDGSREPDIYVMQVMTFGATCSPSSAQFVKNKNAEEFREQYPRAVRAIIDNHYVDDLLDCTDTNEEAIQLANDVKNIHYKGGFQIRNWLSNSTYVTKALSDESTMSAKNMNMSQETIVEKVLGMWWCTTTDTFTFLLTYNKSNKDILSGKVRPTKREVLRTLMSIFDPLGLLANFLVYVKILLQEIWRSSVEWDQQITDSQYVKWLQWIKLLPQVEKMHISRCYCLTSPLHQQESIQIHIFMDASSEACAAVAYFRIKCEDNIYCTLIGAKTKVAPVKMMSIPRLELQAAVMGSRFCSAIVQAHTVNISQRFFWTDSRTVICWLRSEQRKYRQFVGFRVGEILETTELKDWRWLPSKENVADEGTKWDKHPELTASSRWINGPTFLQYPDDQWPSTVSEVFTTTEELRPHLSHNSYSLPRIIEVDRFSNWTRLLRTTAYVFRYLHNVSCKKQNKDKRVGPITKEDYQDAERVIFQQAQFEGYPDEVATLIKTSSSNATRLEKCSAIYKQSPYIDEKGILRARGRIDEATDVDDDFKRPILLPRLHHVTRLIVRHYHRKYHHHNHQTALNEIVQRFRIPRVRAILNTEKNACQICKNYSAEPRIPEMANLPYARIATYTRPFSYIGIDYFGPMTVLLGRRTEKRWGVLVTCLTTRVIHIEIAHSLTTDSCILCLRNFICRRGNPLEIYSDNGTNFKGADNELQTASQNINVAKLSEEFNSSITKWMFIPPSSPHMGGSWERLVRSVKTTLKHISLTRNPSDELLRSMLIEAENIVNSRPLTYIPADDITDEILTPNHFLLGSSSGVKPVGTLSDDSVLLKRNWLLSQQFANRFWKRWVQEYLPTLTRHTKWFERTTSIEQGDLVIIVDETLPRNCWPKGRILETIPSRDGQIRRAIVQTAKGVYERPVAKLAKLDVKAKDIGKPIETTGIPGGSVGNPGFVTNFTSSDTNCKRN